MHTHRTATGKHSGSDTECLPHTEHLPHTERLATALHSCMTSCGASERPAGQGSGWASCRHFTAGDAGALRSEGTCPRPLPVRGIRHRALNVADIETTDLERSSSAQREHRWPSAYKTYFGHKTEERPFRKEKVETVSVQSAIGLALTSPALPGTLTE